MTPVGMARAEQVDQRSGGELTPRHGRATTWESHCGIAANAAIGPEAQQTAIHDKPPQVFAGGTLRDWEQHRSKPDQAAESYLKVIAKNPKAVMKALDADAAE